ncbi:MAG: hydroxymethylglutaryl-CoA lyase [Phycisphaerae bacterium]|nr:hydroxymethylglutaryl-CoA lyase [Phycisphaerae bacterium]
MNPTIRITEVGPRDGLQNEPAIITTADKLRLVEQLCRAGFDEIEVSSFVSPKWVPQLGDAAELFAAAARFKPAGVLFSALVPNEKGLTSALAVNASSPIIDKLSVFTSASETFAKKNTNATIAETLQRFEPVVAAARDHRLLVRGYVSCAIACPFEGPIAPAAVADVCRRLRKMGIDEIDVADTIGVATTDAMHAMLTAVLTEIPPADLTLHLHDTFGRAADCVRVALDLGLRSFDSAVAGLGGCPYASTPQRRAPGNIATETLLATIAAWGGQTRHHATTGAADALLNARKIALEITQPK